MRKQIYGDILNVLTTASADTSKYKNEEEYTNKVKLLVHEMLRDHAIKGNIDRAEWMKDNEVRVRVIDNTVDIGLPGWLEEWLNKGDES